MAMYGDGVGLEGPWEAPRRVHVGVLTIVHATMTSHDGNEHNF